jgi:hypothetical protein
MDSYVDPVRHCAPATFATTDDNLLPFSFPAVARKKVAGAFDGARISSDGGLMLLAIADRFLGPGNYFARCFPDHRDPERFTHELADMMRARVTAIACGYEDASIFKRTYRPVDRLLRNVAWG